MLFQSSSSDPGGHTPGPSAGVPESSPRRTPTCTARRQPADLRDLRRYADLRIVRDVSLNGVLRHRARALAADDRAMVEAVLIHGDRVAHLAAIANLPAPALRRRLKRLLTRVLSPEFACVQSNASAWPPLRRAVAQEVFLHGRSMRDAARTLGLPLHAVRRHTEAVRALTEHTRPIAQEEAA